MAKLFDIMINYKEKMGIVDKTEDLERWINELEKYGNNHLPVSLINSIYEDIKFFWANDRKRLSEIVYKEEHSLLPENIRHRLVVDFLYHDIFSQYKRFFVPKLLENKRLLHDFAMGFFPR